MAKNQLYSVNFGSSRGGLSTVGYTIYNSDGTIKTARSTTGVIEIGTSTGIYAANISLDENSSTIVLWDTGQSTKKYAVEEYRNQLNSIQDNTDFIRLIWNTLKNQSELFGRLIDKIDKVKGLITSISENIYKIEKKEFPKYNDNIDIINKLFNDINVKIDFIPKDKINIPNYSNDLIQLKNMLNNLSNELNGIKSSSLKINKEIDKIPKKYKEYDNDFRGINMYLSDIQKNIKMDTENNKNNIISKFDDLKNTFYEVNTNNLIEKIDHIKLLFNNLSSILSKVVELNNRVVTSHIDDKDILKARNYISKEIININKSFMDFTKSINASISSINDKNYAEKISRENAFNEAKDTNNIIMAYGHRRKNG